MTSAEFEHLIPGFAELRAAERQNRGLAFARLTHTVCGVEIKPLAPLHRLALQLVRNAFACPGADPQRGDVFQFLWLLSPEWRPPGGRGGLQIVAAWKRWRLRRHVARLDLVKARAEICRYLAAQLQDAPRADDVDADGIDQGPWIHWAAQDAGFWLNVHGGFTLQSYLETPCAVLEQLFRTWKCNHPRIEDGPSGQAIEAEQEFTNESDRLFRAWHRQHRAAIAEHIKSQRERRN